MRIVSKVCPSSDRTQEGIAAGQSGIAIQLTETNHRIANSLQFVAAMLRHEASQLTSVESARTALDNAAGRLSAVARMHRQLTRDMPEDEVDLREFLEPLCADLSQSIATSLEVIADDVKIRADVAAQICIIVNELAMNAVKHGGHDGEPVVLTLIAARRSGDRLHLVISDNGSGLPTDFDLGDAGGLGMIIITSTVEKLGGTIRIADTIGAGFEISLPLNRTRATLHA